MDAFLVVEVMMRAAVDIGSNTVQMLAGEISQKAVIPKLHFLATTRLGEGGQNGLLKEDNIYQTVDALIQIKLLLDKAGIDEVRLVATSAVRDAVNKEILLKAAEEACGWRIDVLGGKEEARLAYIGAASLINKDDEETSPLIVDIGGGSTEIIWRDEGGALIASSANLGALRAKLAAWDESRIKSILHDELIWPCATRPLIGVGGTVTTSAALVYGIDRYSREAVHGKKLTYEQILSLREKLAALTDKDRCAYSPLLAQRGGIIVNGLDILSAILEILDADFLLASDAGILDGVLLSWEK